MRRLVIAAILTLVCFASANSADVVMKTESWANSDEDFAKFDQRIASMNLRNLLARRGVKVTVETRDVTREALRLMCDGNAGERCSDGRAFVGGAPSIITFYLGKPKTITQVGVFTFNSDPRTNQDYEVRFFNNSAHPGKKPKFPAKPDLTTGDTVIGNNRGGFHSYFTAKDGGALVPGKADWVQFKIWRTYNVKAGSPAKARNMARSFTTVIELEVLGGENDVIKLTKEEIEHRDAIRKAPKRPTYEKKATWQETMIAAREAVFEWESLQDRLAAPDSPVQFGPWHMIGPVAPSSKLAREIEAQPRVDLKKQYAGTDGKPLVWQEVKGVEDTKLIDLSKCVKIEPGQVVYLCRTMSVKEHFDHKNPFAIGIGMGHGAARILPGNRSLKGRSDGKVRPNELSWQMTIGRGNYQVLVRLQRPKDSPWAFWFSPHPPTTHPGAGSTPSRVRRRQTLFAWARRDFPDPVSRQEIAWEEADDIGFTFGPDVTRRRTMRLPADWAPGDYSFLKSQYRAAIKERLAVMDRDLIPAEAKSKRQDLAAALKRLGQRASAQDLDALRKAYYTAATLQETLTTQKRISAIRMAVDDQGETFGDRYPKAELMQRVDAMQAKCDTILRNVLATGNKVLKEVLMFRDEIEPVAREILLANPLLDFDRLLIVKRSTRNLGLPANWQGNSSLRKTGYDNEIAVLPMQPNPAKTQLTTLYRPPKGEFVGDVDLHFDADRMLFSSIGSHERWQVFEMKTDGTGLRQVTLGDQPDVDNYDACYLPDGDIIFSSSANFVGVPCVFGSSHVAMLYRMNADGKNIRQLCFEQDHNWCPTMLPNGRVLYLRWEYTDTPHSNTRLLFQMNPDGTGQMEFYGSNSYWPNSIFYARPIPGSSTKVIGIVTGHHGDRRMGELVLFDVNKGRREADGAVQKIPGYGKKVEPIIRDQLTSGVWPKFLHPYPLSDKYFLVACRPTQGSNWGLYLVDVFNNMLLLREEPGYALLEPIPIRKTEKPPVIPSRVRPGEQYATVYMADVYAGNGLKGIPSGTVKRLRIFTYHFAYQGMGGILGVVGLDGPWDIKRVLGTVPVEKDGSAMFRVPANTPISVQPLDAEGKAVQIMRSWMTAMPGDVLSCVGCHEPQSESPPPQLTIAARHFPSDIKPWHGPTRGFSYPREVQPVIDRYCVKCHNGKARSDGKDIPDLRGDAWITDFRSVTPGNGGGRGGKFSVGYANLQRYVRRPGIESDYHLLTPMEFHADTTELVQMLKKGHHGVTLDPEAWDRLITWIDLNTPFHGTWHEYIKDPGPQRQRRRELRKLYAGIDEDPEAIIEVKYSPPNGQPETGSANTPQSEIHIPQLEGWPFDAAEAKRRQSAAGPKTKRTIDLGNGVTMDLVLVPDGEFVMGDAKGGVDEQPLTRVKIDRPFWMGTCEVTNEQYAQFDPLHDSAVESKNAYQFGIHGYPLNGPRQPVVRVSWQKAMAFCRWLSQKTGKAFTLPTEAQWEYACRSGAATPMFYGDLDTDFSRFANMADAKLREFASDPYTVDVPLTNATKYDDWIPKDTRFNDGGLVTVDVGKYAPNAWGLHDMHGNVWEWTRTTYKPYPYRTDDGRDDIAPTDRKVVRGGSWRDRPKRCRASFRLSYLPYQAVHDVGFRVVCVSDGG
ncbi:MAG: SUMF1/EgtB/PvdO family nonheme iron enzyme [Planctomycetes bacterium]|nr:SUMF1/EgtB/PvdO family nonheme iron enzyme [Planctomycetota bacterium]